MMEKEVSESHPPSDWESMLDQYYLDGKEILKGKIVKGKIVKITSSYAVVDIGYKSDGIVQIDELKDYHGELKVREGSDIYALVENASVRDGTVQLSKLKADKVIAWDILERAYKHGFPVRGKIIEKANNGFIVDVGIPVLLPKSHLDLAPVKNTESFIGKEFKFKVIELNKKTEKIVVSRKIILEEEKETRRRRTLATLKEGKIVMGKITSIKDFGVFVDLGGIEGLLHINDISWGRIEHPSEVFNENQEIAVMILKIDPANGRIALGYKQRFPDPWENVDKKYPVGSRVKGKVLNITEFGVFVELEKGVEGLVHISDLSWKNIKHPREILNVGDTGEFVVLDIKRAKKRIALGLKQLMPSPWDVFLSNYKEGSIVKGRIKNITDFGAFMEIEEGVEGLIHISDISWSKIEHPSEILKPGMETEAVILSIKREERKVSLGIKQLSEAIWRDFFSKYKVGDIVEASIKKIVNYGVFVEIFPGIEGLVHKSQLSEERIENIEEHFRVGEKKEALITKIDLDSMKIALSFKAVSDELRRREISALSSEKPDIRKVMERKLTKLKYSNKKK
ncbi:MAG: 30S ribosomal protein S1 [Candidatus Aminicenantia bacterium]